MSIKTAKKGTKVKCVEAGNNRNLTTGRIYEVAEDYNGNGYLKVFNNAGGKDSFFSHRFEAAVMNSFKKSELTPGMRIKYRDGEENVFTGKSFVRMGTMGLENRLTADRFSEDLKHNATPNYDIMEIWAAPKEIEDFFDLSKKGCQLFNRDEETPQKKELREIEEELKKLQVKAEQLRQSL